MLWPSAVLCLLVSLGALTSAAPELVQPSLTDSALKAMKKIYSQCENSSDMFKCAKIQVYKLTDRAIKVQNLKLVDGVAIVRKNDITESRGLKEEHISDNDITRLPSEKVDALLAGRVGKFMATHQLQVNIPQLLTKGITEGRKMVEGRGKKMKKYLGPFLAAIAIKGGILTMVYHSIAIVAGKALIIGKIALVISAIIGLKKLVTPEGHEKTTYEIVKHPHVQQSHTYSASHGEFEGHEGGQYHRSLGGDDMVMSDRAYRSYAPKQ
jgi:Protein of unknown function (DUF1676)